MPEKTISFNLKSQNKADKFVVKIKQEAQRSSFINDRNNFASFRPYRDYENDSVYFPNNHLIVYYDKYKENKEPNSDS